MSSSSSHGLIVGCGAFLAAVVDAADLSIVKSVTSIGPYSTTQNATFLITVANAGPSPAAAVMVSDALPAGTTLVSATPSQGSCSGTATVTCDLGALASGAGASITLVLRLDTVGTKTNTATVTTTTPDPVDANNSSTTAIDVRNIADIPTLSEWMLIALAFALASVALANQKASL